jgi:iron complex outermembrane receptor protein
MLKFLLLSTTALLLSSSCLAQFTVTGTVRDAQTHQALAGATIQIKGTPLGTVADEFGHFAFYKLSPGTYIVSGKFLGYSEKSQTVNLTADTPVNFDLEETAILTEAVIVSATRATDKTPTTYTTVAGEKIQQQNFGQDLPLILNWTPSVVTTTDAGAGVGYTGIRIRGSGASHINVTINGIPYNDSESQGVYWVDIPDVASSTKSIQIQRGVGTSTNGAGAFGGSVNLQTTSLQEKPYAEVSNSYGSFNTHKHTLKAGTGLINNRWAFDGRISKIKSDGYIERASADLGSYYLSGGYYGTKTLIKAIMFGGHELTYQSWYGSDPDRMKINRRFNYAGAIYDDLGNVSRYYDRQVDDYRQDHYQLHFSHQLSDYWNVNAAVHYTYGRGYYEEYLQGQSYAGLGLQNIVIGNDTISSGDFVRRQWLDNRFYGLTYSINHTKERLNFTLGGALNRYGNAKHFGEIIWAQYAGPTNLRDHYYDAESQKTDFNIYTKINYDLSENLNAFLDVQYRQLSYRSAGLDENASPYSIDDQFHFFNPKLGLSYSLAGNDVLYASYAIAHREPNRADYLGGSEKPRSEELGNLEAGWRRKTSQYTLEVNYYQMNYKDQLVFTGQLNSVGYPIRANAGKSYRTGIEVSGAIRLGKSLSWNANVTWSKNKNRQWVAVDEDSNAVMYKNTTIVLSPSVIAGSQLILSAFKGAQVALLTKYVSKQYLDNTQNENTVLASYFVNDIRLSYTWAPSFVRAIDFGLLLNNIFDTQYSSNGVVYTGTPYYYPQAGRNYLAMITIKF